MTWFLNANRELADFNIVSLIYNNKMIIMLKHLTLKPLQLCSSMKHLSRGYHLHQRKLGDIPFEPITSPSSSPSSSLHTNHLTTLAEWDPYKIRKVVWRGLELKRKHQVEKSVHDPFLSGKTLALLFSKKSTRTRVSAESAWAAFGGHTMFLGSQDIQLGVNETLRDTAQVLGSMVDMILARVGPHDDITELCRHSKASVVNALSDKFHPLQILADLMTIAEVFHPNATKSTDLFPVDTKERLKLAWVGDANNILNSLAVTLPRLGIHLEAACPSGYDMDKDVLDFVLEGNCFDPDNVENTKDFGRFVLKTRPDEILQDAKVIVTDTWVSMGQESEKAKRLRDFAGFQVTEAMAGNGKANPEWKFMHCLPRKQEEVDDEVFYGPRSLVFEEALNRKYSKMAVFELLMKHQ